MNESNTNPYRLGRRPGEQGPRPLPSNQGTVEKLATGKQPNTTKNTHRLKLVKNTLTVGTWNVQTLWAAGKLELLRNEMKRFRYDIIGISGVRWTGKGETPAGDFIWSGEEKMHMRGVGFLLSAQAKKALIGYNPISSRIITARFDAAPWKLTVIHVYAPTSSSPEEDIEAFYSDIEDVLSKTDKKGYYHPDRRLERQGWQGQQRLEIRNRAVRIWRQKRTRRTPARVRIAARSLRM